MGNIYDHDKEFIEAFLSDVNDNQETFEWAIYDLEKTMDSIDDVNKAFRAVHNLKGITAMMELQNISHFIHKIEDMLHLVREKKVEVNEGIIDVLYVANSLLDKAFKTIIDTGNDGDLEFESVINSLKIIIDKKHEKKLETKIEGFESDKLKEKIETLVKNSNQIYDIKVMFNKDAVFLKVRAFMVIQELMNIGVVIDSSPKSSNLKEDSFEMTTELGILFASQNERNAILSKIIHLSDIDFVDVKRFNTKELNKEFHCTMAEENSIVLNEIAFREFEGKKDFLDQIIVNANEIALLTKRLDEDVENMSILYEIYRNFHTIKGLGGLIGDNYIKAAVNEIELYIDKIRKNKTCSTENTGKMLYLAKLLKKISNIIDEKQFTEFHEEIRGFLLDIKSEYTPNSEKAKVEKILNGDIEEFTKTQKFENKVDDLKEEVLLDKKNQKLAVVEEQKKNLLAKKDLGGFNPDNYIKVNMSKIDNLSDMISEIMILQGQVEEDLKKYEIEPKVINNIIKSSKLTKDVHNLTLLISMISLKGTFQKIHKAAKDAALELGKNISIEFVGEETTIDRSIADKISEPLLHMIKNSISHGIENEEERIKVKKIPQGKIKVEALNEKGSVYIKITDDGKGLDHEKIYEKALENNLIDKTKSYKPEEIYEFIFLPGFSTAKEVNRISGRGVGMDIVKTTLKKLNGKLQIENDKGKGLSFTMKIPINMSAMNGTVVELESGKFIIPSINIHRIVSSDKGEFIDKFGKKSFFKTKESLYPIIKLEKIFARDNIKNDYELMFIIEHDKRKMALPIKKILDKREIIVKDIGEELNQSDYFQGACILGDGKVSLIIDVEKIFETCIN